MGLSKKLFKWQVKNFRSKRGGQNHDKGGPDAKCGYDANDYGFGD